MQLLQEKKPEVEKLAKELLDKEVLHKSDVEELIGKRPFEEKKILEDIEPDPIGGVPPAEIITTLPVVDDPIHPIKAED